MLREDPAAQSRTFSFWTFTKSHQYFSLEAVNPLKDALLRRLTSMELSKLGSPIFQYNYSLPIFVLILALVTLRAYQSDGQLVRDLVLGIPNARLLERFQIGS